MTDHPPSPPRPLRTAAVRLARDPGGFLLSVIRQFRANQGFLLAGAVAYYAMLSLVPLIIISLMMLSRLFPEDRVLSMLRAYLEFIVPGQAAALVDGARVFLQDRGKVGAVMLLSMVFFSSLAFTALENAMTLIFFHRVRVKRRHFLVSAVMPYLFILFLAAGLIVVTVASGMLQAFDARVPASPELRRIMDGITVQGLYAVGVAGEIALLSAIYLVMPVGRLSLRHAVIGGTAATVLWEITRHLLAVYFATVSQIQVVYGTLATAVGVLLSVELGALVLLAGAQVIAEYERLGRA